MDPITSVVTKVTADAVKEVAKESKEPKKTFDDLWYLTFGKIGLTADKMRFKHQVDLENYKASIIEEIESIPDKNLQEPKMSIVGPALDAARFYIEEKEIRDMFTEVISASFDKTKSQNVHHSFIEIIKQITPLEAKLLKLFKDSKHYSLPSARVSVKNKHNSFIEIDDLLIKGFLEDIDTGKEYTIEISNLIRLNLITESKTILEDHLKEYSFFENTTCYKRYFEIVKNRKNKCKLVCSHLKLTPLGEKLVNICFQ